MYSSSLKQIERQLDLVYDGDPWYGSSIRTVLESVDPAMVFNFPANGGHSIAELLAHMLAWREFAERRLKGEDDYLPDQEQTFNWDRFSNDKERFWGITRNRLHANQQTLLALLRQHDDSLLQREVAGKPYTFGYLLTGLVQHDVYHLGQIVYIQRLLEEKNRNLPMGSFLRYSYRIFPFESLALQK